MQQQSQKGEGRAAGGSAEKQRLEAAAAAAELEAKLSACQAETEAQKQQLESVVTELSALHAELKKVKEGLECMQRDEPVEDGAAGVEEGGVGGVTECRPCVQRSKCRSAARLRGHCPPRPR